MKKSFKFKSKVSDEFLLAEYQRVRCHVCDTQPGLRTPDPHLHDGKQESSLKSEHRETCSELRLIPVNFTTRGDNVTERYL